MKKLLLFPFNGNCKEALSVVEEINSLSPTWDVLGFIDDDPGKSGEKFGHYDVLGGRDLLYSDHQDAYILAAPGRPENYTKRKAIIDSLGLPQDRFASIVHPTATIGMGCTIGKNCILMPNVVLTADVTIGNHIVILPNSVISHDTTVEDYVMIGSNVSISGYVKVRENSYIGTGTKIIQNVEVGKQSLVGLGSVVISNIPPTRIYAGCPAKDIYET